MATPEEWTVGYARQAGADFATFLHLLEEGDKIPWCHKLQFLQMACEKLVKAHLIDGGADPVMLQSSHTRIAGTLPVVIRQQLMISQVGTHNAQWNIRHARLLAEEIELLAPAVKRGGVRPDNCEYPWEDAAGNLRVPLDWKFKSSDLLLARAARTFLKLVQDAIKRLKS
jgi:hypothetical protein